MHPTKQLYKFVPEGRGEQKWKYVLPLKQLWGYRGERRLWGQTGRLVNRLVYRALGQGRGLVISGQQWVSFPLKCISGDRRPSCHPGGRSSFGHHRVLGGDVWMPGILPRCFLSMGVLQGRVAFPALFFHSFFGYSVCFVSVFPPSCFPGSPGGAAGPEWGWRLQCTLWGEHRQPGRPRWWRVPRSVSSYLPSNLPLSWALRGLPAHGKAHPCTLGRGCLLETTFSV